MLIYTKNFVAYTSSNMRLPARGLFPIAGAGTTRARFLGREDERVSPVTPAVPQAYSAHPTVVITAALPLPV